MKKKTLMTSLLLLFLAVSAEAVEYTNWNSIRFETMRGSIAGFSVETQVSNMADDVEFAKKLEQGKTWACITEVLAVFAEGQKEMQGKDFSQCPFPFEAYTQHSGKNWSFWYKVALMAKTGEELGLLDQTFTPECLNVMWQMEGAFMPYLYPQKQ